jgi:hypothetical protein
MCFESLNVMGRVQTPVRIALQRTDKLGTPAATEGHRKASGSFEEIDLDAGGAVQTDLFNSASCPDLFNRTKTGMPGKEKSRYSRKSRRIPTH